MYEGRHSLMQPEIAQHETQPSCQRCGSTLENRCIDHDVGALLGLPSVLVRNLPVPVCVNCGAVVVPGSVLDSLALVIAAQMLSQPQLEGLEVRYLRKLVGDTQEEFGARFGISRQTVARWEGADSVSESLTGANAYAVRSHLYFRLKERSPIIGHLDSFFVNPPILSASHEHEGKIALDYARIIYSLTTGLIDPELAHG